MVVPGLRTRRGRKDCHQLVRRRPKLARLDQRGMMRFEKGQLLGRVRAQIHLGRLEAGMTQPKGDLADITGSLQRVHGTAVPQHMRGHVLVGDRRDNALCRSNVLTEPVGETIPCHRAAIAVQEEFRPDIVGTDGKPGPNGCLRLLPERQHPLPTALPKHPDVCERAPREIVHPNCEKFRRPQSCGIGQVKHRPITQPSRHSAVWGRKQGAHLVLRQVVDQLYIRAFDGQRPDHHRLFEAGWTPWFKEAEKRLDRCQPGIAGSHGIGSTLFDVLKKGPDQPDVEILDRKVRRLSFKACGRKPQQECERVGIGGDGMLAGATPIGQMLLQESRQVRRERGHATPPIHVCSAVAAIICNKTGVASRYQ